MKRLQRLFAAFALAGAILILHAEASAHAVVIRNSLAAQPIRRDAPGRIVLQFNSRIEVKLSRAVLVSRDQPEQPLALAAGASAGEIVVALPPLAPGDYAVRYRVLAADGHVTEETLRFAVAP
jgi:methionine-rich copper-binding protein CopC